MLLNKRASIFARLGKVPCIYAHTYANTHQIIIYVGNESQNKKRKQTHSQI